MILTPDRLFTLGGVGVFEFLLTEHNPNRIAMPTASMEGRIMGVTIHNTDRIQTASNTTPAEQYTRATYNGNMNDVRVHYFVDDTCAWQNLPHELSGWHAADGSGNGNRRTIAIECIMSSAYDDKDRKSEDNAAKLAAALLAQYGLGIEHLFTHTHWLNVRDGKTGSTDALNVMQHSYKMCPAYILPHWKAFRDKTAAYLAAAKKALTENASGNDGGASADSTAGCKPYRVRKSWTDAQSQIGAFSTPEAAKEVCLPGYSIFDATGRAIYTAPKQTAEELLQQILERLDRIENMLN